MAPRKSNVNSLIQARLSVKSQLNRISEYVKAFTVGDNIQQIIIRGEKVTDLWNKYEEVQLELESINFHDHQEYRITFEEEYYDTSADIKRIIQEQNLSIKNSQQTQVVEATTSQRQQQAEPNNLSSRINLPKMNLPQFSGEYKDWCSFYDLFKAIIHENNTISDIEKLHYLKSSLTGDALKIIDSIPSTSDNYGTAFQLLIDRYDNNQVIINAHLNNLFALTAIQKQSATALRTLITNSKQQIESLKTFKLPVEHWDVILIHMLTQKLDFSSRREYELRKIKDKLPKLTEFFSFLEARCLSLEAFELSTQTLNKTNTQLFNKSKFKSNPIIALGTTQTTGKCHLCQGNHRLYKCDKFHALDVKNKIEAVKTAKVCFNCLNPGHGVKQCNATHCKKCSKPHSTFIHYERVTNQESEDKSSKEVQQPTEQDTHTLLNSSYPKQVLLSTAIIRVRNKSGAWINCRALLDSGSQSNCVTEDLINQLNIEKKEYSSKLIGINGSNTQVTKSVKLNISSRVTDYQNNLEFLVLDKITADLPVNYMNVSTWNLPKNIKLADPSFNEPGQIDLLIGAEIYLNILKIGQRKLGDGLPLMQNSSFGWILSGKVTGNSQTNTSYSFLSSVSPTTDEILLRFWELETFPKKTIRSKEETECEEHFQRTITRDESGRYIAQLPVREEKLKLIGDSRKFAEQRLHYLWKRLSTNSQLQEMYVAFMQEYLNLMHMELVDNNFAESDNNSQYFIPHHAVIKESNNGSKLRVVFDASMKSDTGVSLNDALKVGPVVQQDLLSIVMRFRLYKYAFTSDIQKIYRQILIDEDQHQYQLILWKFNPEEEVKTYRLRTVTYGTASAPYIATKCIQHLAITQGDSYPLAKSSLLENCYVDDIMSGANSLPEAISMQQQLIKLLDKSGFTLHKWCANHNDLLMNIESSKRETTQTLEIGKEAIKTLGLLWLPSEDKLKFAVKLKECPIIIKAKLFLQELWKLKISWDEEVPTVSASEWLQFRRTLQTLENIEVDRRIVKIESSNLKYELHGFADASQLAYGACLYLKAVDNNGEASIQLLSAKSRIAPIKPTTIPRLELCAALVLARLVEKVLNSLQLSDVVIYLWTDSTIVLSWLSSEASKYKTFVGNRVLEIQELTKHCSWSHVPTTQNPADYISRGINPMELKESNLWWKGPSWLQLTKSEWPRMNIVSHKNKDLELKPIKTISTACVEKFTLFTKFSTLTRLQRVTAYMRRFVHNARSPMNKNQGCLSVTELQSALTCLIKVAQNEEFKAEMKQLKNNNEITHGNLKSLTPFIGEQGLLRVDGRLENSLRNYDNKHPIILPKNHKLTDLVLQFEHRRLLHAGNQAVLGSIRQKYWPIHGRSMIRRIIYKCVICYRHKAKASTQLMGNLPSYRTQPFRAFLNTGVDYGGPILIKSGNRRNSLLIKSYITLFICLSTRAIHLELVTSLNTQSFISAFKRFISRRGLCQTIHSDNATNFKGADREIKELYKLFQNKTNQAEIINEASKIGVQWKFIPPSSPHVGGIWEAGIKAVKYHLKRILGTLHLTFEETYTLLTQIEACVNSRPLSLISDDPTDPSILTPAHFLIGCPLTAMPEPDLSSLEETRLSKWQRMQAQLQSFWNRWLRDYLNTLQQRSKWVNTTPNLKRDDVVLLKEDNQPPLHWPLARVHEVHPGPDGRVRFATVVTTTGSYKRPITKLCLLPSPTEDLF